jgi:hypothetical protein
MGFNEYALSNNKTKYMKNPVSKRLALVFLCVIWGICFLLGSLFSLSFNMDNWNLFSKIVFWLLSLYFSVTTLSDYFIFSNSRSKSSQTITSSTNQKTQQSFRQIPEPKAYWTNYKYHYPQKAQNIEVITGIDFSLLSSNDGREKVESLERMANNNHCSLQNLKDTFFNNLEEKKFNLHELKIFIQSLNSKAIEESNYFHISESNTVSQFMKIWVQEFINNKRYKDKIRSRKEVLDDLVEEHPELQAFIYQENFSDISQDIAIEVIEDFEYMNKPAERYIRQIIDLQSDNNHKGAVDLITKVLQFNDKENEPWLYKMRAENYNELKDNKKALDDINKALSLKDEKDLEQAYHISQFYKLRSKIKNELGDFVGADTDKLAFNKFDAISKEYCKTHPSNDLPF